MAPIEEALPSLLLAAALPELDPVGEVVGLVLGGGAVVLVLTAGLLVLFGSATATLRAVGVVAVVHCTENSPLAHLCVA